nr:MAG TPA: hypothetical protein [Caudoviricetes sp.]
MAKGSVNISGMSEEDIERCISTHDDSADAHKDIRTMLAKLRADLSALALKTATDITQNAFTVTFEVLNNTTMTGVWNTSMARIEF